MFVLQKELQRLINRVATNNHNEIMLQVDWLVHHNLAIATSRKRKIWLNLDFSSHHLLPIQLLLILRSLQWVLHKNSLDWSTDSPLLSVWDVPIRSCWRWFAPLLPDVQSWNQSQERSLVVRAWRFRSASGWTEQSNGDDRQQE